MRQTQETEGPSHYVQLYSYTCLKCGCKFVTACEEAVCLHCDATKPQSLKRDEVER